MNSGASHLKIRSFSFVIVTYLAGVCAGLSVILTVFEKEGGGAPNDLEEESEGLTLLLLAILLAVTDMLGVTEAGGVFDGVIEGVTGDGVTEELVEGVVVGLLDGNGTK